MTVLTARDDMYSSVVCEWTFFRRKSKSNEAQHIAAACSVSLMSSHQEPRPQSSLSDGERPVRGTIRYRYCTLCDSNNDSGQSYLSKRHPRADRMTGLHLLNSLPTAAANRGCWTALVGRRKRDSTSRSREDKVCCWLLKGVLHRCPYGRQMHR